MGKLTDDLDALDDLPLIIANWVFKRTGRLQSLDEARRAARAALRSTPAGRQALQENSRG